jgi:ATP-dependent Zn protease
MKNIIKIINQYNIINVGNDKNKNSYVYIMKLWSRGNQKWKKNKKKIKKKKIYKKEKGWWTNIFIIFIKSIFIYIFFFFWKIE